MAATFADAVVVTTFTVVLRTGLIGALAATRGEARRAFGGDFFDFPGGVAFRAAGRLSFRVTGGFDRRAAFRTGTRALAAVLLPFMRALGKDKELMGEHALGRTERLITAVAFALIAVSVGALGVLAVA